MSHMPELEASVLPADAVEVGRIADAWGIKGWFKVAAFSSDPEALRGARIFVARSDFPQPEDGEYYWVDLLGLSVVNREGVALGIVRDLLSTGPQTVLVLAYEEDGKERERMIPFVDAYVDKVDLPGKTIVADWQPDY